MEVGVSASAPASIGQSHLPSHAPPSFTSTGLHVQPNGQGRLLHVPCSNGPGTGSAGVYGVGGFGGPPGMQHAARSDHPQLSLTACMFDGQPRA